MKQEDLTTALAIIKASAARTTVSFNVPVNDHVSNVYDIVIHESNATLISKLVEAGYSLHMSVKGLVVNKH